VNRNAGIAGGTVVIAVAGVVIGVLVGGRVGQHAGSGASPSSSASADISAAIVNINGTVPGGRIAGTGMIISSDGTVLTNNHVVAGTSDLTAQVGAHGRVYNATVVGVDPTQDVAVIRLQGASAMATVPLESSGVVNLGDDVTAEGNALGRNGAPVVVTGKVISLDQTLTVRSEGNNTENALAGLIQFNAPIQPGDSGGPLLDEEHRVIGMDTAGSPTTGDQTATYGAAIPIDTAIGIAHQIIAGTSSPYIQSGHSGVLGLAVADTSTRDGARVISLTGGDAGALAGIALGEVITSFAGTAITSAADFQTASQGWRPGDQVSISWRDGAGASHTATATLSPGPPA
jgi:S1-C subfamily serine protease